MLPAGPIDMSTVSGVTEKDSGWLIDRVPFTSSVKLLTVIATFLGSRVDRIYTGSSNFTDASGTATNGS